MQAQACFKPRANRPNNVRQQLPTLLDVTRCVPLHTLLRVVARCWELLRKVWNRSNFSANNSQHFFYSVIAKRNNVGSVCIATSNTAHYTWSSWRLQCLMGCILPTMHCRSQHCQELSHPLEHHCQHGRNNSQHCVGNINGPTSHVALNAKFIGHKEKAYSGTIKLLQLKSP